MTTFSFTQNYASALSLFLVDVIQDQFVSCLDEVGFGGYLFFEIICFWIFLGFFLVVVSFWIFFNM